MKEYITKSTSRNSADVNEIVLKENTQLRLVFIPKIINNPHNPECSVEGTFRVQRKKKNDFWENLPTKDTRNLDLYEGYIITLDSEQTHEVFKALHDLYMIKSPDVFKGNWNHIITDKNIDESIIDLAKYLIENKEELKVETIKELTEFDTVSNIAKLKNVYALWDKEKNNNHDELYWQKIVKDNSYIVSYAFTYPIVIIDGAGFAGGTSIFNKGSKLPDILFSDYLSNNIVIVEMKKPDTEIIEKSHYRNGAYPITQEISGSIIQLLSYKNSLMHSYFAICHDTNFKSFDPKMILIAGKKDSLTNDKMLESFELFRSNLKNIDIITYDELFERLKQILELLESKSTLDFLEG